MQNKLLLQQYELARSSRGVLLDFLEQLAPAQLRQEIPDFGRGSIRNLLVHTVNTYRFWLLSFARRDSDVQFADPEAITTLSECRNGYAEVDAVVSGFIGQFGGRLEEAIQGEIRGTAVSASPLKLFTHVITHEFHHKGQILSMARHLGYVPVDTDVIR